MGTANPQHGPTDASDPGYRLVLESSPAPIAIHRAGTLVYVNVAAAALVGAATPEELISRSMLDFVHPAFREAVLARARQTQAQDQTQAVPPIEEKFRTLDGRTIDVEVSALPARYAG